MREVEIVVEKHLLFDPLLDNPEDLMEYGFVSVVNELTYDSFDGKSITCRTLIKIDGLTQPDVEINIDRDVLIIRTKGQCRQLEKMTRESFENLYGSDQKEE